MKQVKRQHRWATAKGQVVSVRFSDSEYWLIEARAKGRGMTIGVYLRWLTRATREGVLDLEVGMDIEGV